MLVRPSLRLVVEKRTGELYESIFGARLPDTCSTLQTSNALWRDPEAIFN